MRMFQEKKMNNRSNANDAYEILERRWGDFFYRYIHPDNSEDLPEIPEEVIEKYHLEIEPYINKWSPRDTFITEIIDTHIRTYWQNKLLKDQYNYYKKSKNFMGICFSLILISILYSLLLLYITHSYNKNSGKFHFYQDLISYKWCDSVLETENETICKIGETEYRVKKKYFND